MLYSSVEISIKSKETILQLRIEQGLIFLKIYKFILSPAQISSLDWFISCSNSNSRVCVCVCVCGGVFLCANNIKRIRHEWWVIKLCCWNNWNHIYLSQIWHTHTKSIVCSNKGTHHIYTHDTSWLDTETHNTDTHYTDKHNNDTRIHQPTIKQFPFSLTRCHKAYGHGINNQLRMITKIH